MKRLLYLIILSVLIFTTGCQTALERDKEEMLEIYCSDDNYITLTGKVIEVDRKDDIIIVVIQCDDLKQYIIDADDECEYWVFSNLNANIDAGDTIAYTTVKIRFNDIRWLPIVAITKDGKKILEFEEGKEKLIDWVDELQMK